MPPLMLITCMECYRCTSKIEMEMQRGMRRKITFLIVVPDASPNITPVLSPSRPYLGNGRIVAKVTDRHYSIDDTARWVQIHASQPAWTTMTPTTNNSKTSLLSLVNVVGVALAQASTISKIHPCLSLWRSRSVNEG